MKILERIRGNRDSRIGLIFGFSSAASSAVGMIIGIVLIRWIEPGELGIWQSLSILQLYMPFLELGVPNGLNRELPFLYGKGEKEKGVQYAQSAQFFMIVVAVFLFGATVIATLVMWWMKVDQRLVAGVGTVGLLLSVNAYQRYLTVTYRSAESFVSLSKLYGVQLLAQLVLLPLVWYHQYYGLLTYTFLVAAVFTFAMHLTRPIRNGPDFNKSYLRDLVRTGLPVFMMGYFRGIASSFNRIVLLLKGGTLSVGLFTPVNAIGTMITLLPGILANFFFPKMNYLLGATNEPAKLWPMVVKINLIILLFSIPFVAVVWWTAPFIVANYFEKYGDAIVAMQLFSFNFLFAGTLVSHNVIYAVKAYKLGYAFVGSELLLRFFLPYLFVRFGEGNPLTLVAWGVLISNMLLFLLNIAFIRIALRIRLSA